MAWTERYCTSAGAGAHDGTSEANAWTLAEAIAGVAAGHRVNVKAGTFSNTTTNRTFSTVGTTTAPIWWRGYTSAIGDLDAQPTSTRVSGTDKPLITFTTGRVLDFGDYNRFSNIDFLVTSSTSAATTNTGDYTRFDRCRFENQQASVNSIALSQGGAVGAQYTQCYFKATTTATNVVSCSSVQAFIGCTFRGGGNGVSADLTTGFSDDALFFACVFDDNGTHGLNITIDTTNNCNILHCSFYSPTTDGIRIGNSLATLITIGNCIFDSCGGYGINNNTGANTARVMRFGNAFRNNSSGNESGFGDDPSLYEITETASPWTNAAGHDFSLISTALSKAAGIPGLFENESYRSYFDRGAAQRQELGGLPPRIMQITGAHRSEY